MHWLWFIVVVPMDAAMVMAMSMRMGVSRLFLRVIVSGVRTEMVAVVVVVYLGFEVRAHVLEVRIVCWEMGVGGVSIYLLGSCGTI